MTDKEKIKAEIERLMNWKPKAIPSGMRQRDVLNIRKGVLCVLLTLKDFIDSLPAEKPSEDLEEAANLYANKQGLELKPFARKFFIAGADWQKEQTINKACEWLNKNVVEYHPRTGKLRPVVNINAFREAMKKQN